MLNYSQALDALKDGKRVARAGWNGKGMFILHINGSILTQVINDHYGDPQGEPLQVLDQLYMKTADNKLVAWLASQTDMLADDWSIV